MLILYAITTDNIEYTRLITTDKTKLRINQFCNTDNGKAIVIHNIHKIDDINVNPMYLFCIIIQCCFRNMVCVHLIINGEINRHIINSTKI